MIEQLEKLVDAYHTAKKADPEGYRTNANVLVLASIAKLVLRQIPMDPSDRQYRLGATMGDHYKFWSRARFGERFRMFFRYHTPSKVIVFAWVNDDKTLRSRGNKTDPYTVFEKMLDGGSPPSNWEELKASGKKLPQDVIDALNDVTS